MLISKLDISSLSEEQLNQLRLEVLDEMSELTEVQDLVYEVLHELHLKQMPWMWEQIEERSVKLKQRKKQSGSTNEKDVFIRLAHLIQRKGVSVKDLINSINEGD